MKYLLMLAIIIQMLFYIYNNQEEDESLYIIKSLLYLCISGIHSIIIVFKIPLGAIIMSIVYLFDKKNHSVKLRLIFSGLLLGILGALTYKDICLPIQKIYLHNLPSEIKEIEVHTFNGTTNKFLFNINNNEDIIKYVKSLKESVPYSVWNIKVVPKNEGYLIKYINDTQTIPIIVTPSAPNLPNIYIGKHYISYTNTQLPDLINSYLNVKPLFLEVLNTNTEIHDLNIISNLWEEILWGEQVNKLHYNKDFFRIKTNFIFSQKQKLSISFDTDFNYLIVNDSQIVKISPNLSNKLKEQYVLTQLDNVKQLSYYPPAHVHTIIRSLDNYSIETDSTGRIYGLYMNDETQNKKTLLHNVSSASSEYFLLKNPYILLLDEKQPNKYYLMLINRNLPNKHRYIEKEKNIVPASIALCPSNTKFVYTINNYDSSTLYFVKNYYESPLIIANGNIQDSLFLSDKYIVFTITIDNSNYLCIYDTSLSKTVKYITIPGEVHFIKVENRNILFSIQNKTKKTFKQGIFTLNENLDIKRLK